MPKANEVAMELRKLADALDKEPEATIRRAVVNFYHFSFEDDAKGTFLEIARVLPRPLKKNYSEHRLEAGYRNEAVSVTASIDRNMLCRIIEPAKPAVYDCDPILSPEEESALGGAA